ncbi:MAG: long-chain fatty acid--CoA ligase [Verrucomicrobia bacterium]|nr:long-chain fatty acid--CoA ligase [Verrucomicrobiota bacterium]
MTYPKNNLSQMLEQTVAKSARETALIYFGARISYGDLLDQVNRAAAGLQALGIKKGDRVAMMMPNCPQFVIGYFSALKAGAIITATSPIYTPREAGHQWKDAGASVIIVDQRLLHIVKAVRPELPELKHVAVIGMRDYYPQNYKSLCRKLHAKGGRKRSSAFAQRTSPITWPELLRISKTPRPVSIKQADIACLQYTGGTTGSSKGAMLTHGNLVINANQTRQWLSAGRTADPDVMVAALPLFHIYAMTCIMICSVMTGGTVVLLPRFELKAALNIIRKYHPSFFHGVPTMYVAFNNTPNVERYGFKSLRVCMSGGAPLPIEVRQKFEELTGGKLVEGYGLTESSPVTHTNPPDGVPKIGSIGLPIPDTEVRIVDIETGTRDLPVGEAGEIIIRGPQVMKGYWNKPEETAKVLRDGWLHTGDIAKKDEEGYYYIVDRKKDLIIAGGYNIYPREVEEVLFEHPKIKEAVAVGVPDQYRGETVKAFIVLHEGQTTTPEEIQAFCRERLAAYKVPRMVVFRDSLPKSGVGKYLRRELRNM